MQRSAEQLEQFEATWRNPRGFPAALSEVNNQPIGIRFMVTSFIFFFIGGAMALLMRIQLIVPENTFIGPQLFNELFTMHGSTMMYLFVIPFLEGLALYLIPQMIGSRDVAFPRLTAFSYWVYLFGGFIFYASFLVGAAPDAGWFAYTPLSGPGFAGIELDFWLLGLAMVEIAGIGAGIEIVVTILKCRAPGMSLNRMPIFVWTMLVSGIMIIIAFTVLVVATVLLELDRLMGTHFFSPDDGGSTLLWQHLFWFFGHPDVYIMFLPATGIVSMVIPVFARRPLAVYTLVVVAIVLTGFLSFGLWVHHMYTTGLPVLAMSFFAAASLMIAIGSGIQVFAWIATMWRRKLAYTTPMMYVLGFLFIFVIGGMTGVMIAIVPFDWQVHDTYFIVAHFHYVLVGGVLFPIVAGIHYWFPKMTGRLLSETLGQWSFWLTFLGFNITFFPMHIMGLLGMPRRVYTYPEVLEVGGYNIIATLGSFVLGIGFVVFAWNVYRSRHHGREAGNDPWGGETLEWSNPSPAPSYTFFEPPFVASRHPMWETAEGHEDEGTQGLSQEEEPEQSRRSRMALAGAPAQWRGTLVTDAVTAEPRAVQWLPGPTYVPLFAALGLLVGAVGLLSQYYFVAMFGAILAAGFIAQWAWPNWRQVALHKSGAVEHDSGLPIFPTGSNSVAWWGMISLLVCLSTMVVAMIYSYFFVRMMSDAWPQGGLPLPVVDGAIVAYGVLVFSSALQWLAARSFRLQRHGPARLSLVGVFLLGMIALGVLAWVMVDASFMPQDNAYASFFHVLNALVAVFIVTGLAMNIAMHVRITRDGMEQRSYGPLQMQLTSMFWHFTAAAGVLIFATVFLSPHVL